MSGAAADDEPELPPRWELYRGNNHNVIPDHGIRRGGYISFTRHFGKPLTPELWIDLVSRLGVTNLRIYEPGMGEWCDGPFPGDCRIYLDEIGFVLEIKYCPHPRPFNGNQ